MTLCPKCDTNLREGLCPSCGWTEVSDAGEIMDDMIAKASVPSLATLFRKAKDSGAIGPISGYGGAPNK